MFKTISKIAIAAALCVTIAPASAAGLAGFVGTWTANNSATHGIVKIIITLKDGKLFVRPFGACSPTPCDWGVQRAVAYAPGPSAPIATEAYAATASFPMPAGVHLLTLGHDRDYLSVFDYMMFTDNGRRSNYAAFQTFYR